MSSPQIVFQFKVALSGISPAIWRRIQVPSKYSFWDLHVAIQDSMGWQDCHLHAFRIKRPRGRKFLEIGIPGDEDSDMNILPGWCEYIEDYFVKPGQATVYEYDFGDGWYHEILFEGMLLKETDVKYPVCLDGARACPPEDCGGVGGYENLCKILKDPTHGEYERMTEWLSYSYRGYDPDKFEKEMIKFDNPKRRWDHAFCTDEGLI